MLYSSLDDASNNSLKNKMEQYETINKFDNYNDINISPPSYFTAQGDYSNNNYINQSFVGETNLNNNRVLGTTIDELKNNYPPNNQNNQNNQKNNHQSLVDSLSFDDSILSDDLTLASKFKKKKINKTLDHDYCVNIITKELSSNGDASLMSSHNGKIYKHVKTCSICKNKIKKIMKEQYCNKDDNIINNINVQKQNNVEHFEEQQSIIGYDIKELVLIILGGIILIFVFDLLVKMGEKLRK